MATSITVKKVRECFSFLSPNINTSNIESLIAIADLRSYPEGAIVIKDNVVSQKLFFLLEGSLSATIEKNGKQILLGDTLPGGFIGEVSFFGNCLTTATVTAKTDSKMLVLGKEELKQLQVIAPELVSRLLRVVSKTLTRRLLNADNLLCRELVNENSKSEADTMQALFA